MRIRGNFVLLFLFIFLFNCAGSQVGTKPDSRPETDQQAGQLKQTETPRRQAEYVPEIIALLRQMHSDAMTFMDEGNLLAAHQVFEEALDLMTIYEGENEASLPSEYPALKQSILNDFKGLLKKENIDLHETELDILLEDINIFEKTEADTSATLAPKSPISEFPLVANSRVNQAISYFNNRGRKTYEIWMQRAGKYLPMIYEILDEEGLPRDLAFLPMIESGYRPAVVSRARAVGMWQFIAATGKKYDLKITGFVDERRNPVKATKAAAKHLKDLYYHWGGDWHLALAAYNVSERRIRRDMKRNNTKNFWKMKSLPRQTRNYVPTFIAAATIARNPEKYGFKAPVMKAWVYDEVEVSRQASIDVIAKAAGVPENSVIDLNTELLNWITPKDSYTLRLPKGTGEKFVSEFNALPDDKLITRVVHRVRRGDTLSHIADAYRTSVTQIMRVNNISNPHRLRINQRLTIPVKSAGARNIEQYIASSNRNYNRPRVPKDAGQREKIAYTVRKNDTLWDIAQEFNISLSDLRAWNGLGSRRTIYPNQKLTVYLPKSTSNPARAGNVAASSEKTTSTPAAGKKAHVHVVRRGDTLSRISQSYDVAISDILEWNNLNRRSTIYPGDRITLHLEQNYTDVSDTGYSFYTVRRGDTLWGIAQRFGTTVSGIKRMNSLGNARIYPGDRIRIPSQEKSPSSK